MRLVLSFALIACIFLEVVHTADQVVESNKDVTKDRKQAERSSHHKGYKVVSYDPEHDHLNVIDDEHPAADLRHLNKHPYYEKRSHMLGHRGEHWTEEDRLRVKHHHSKMMNRNRNHHRRNHNKKHHGKVLPNDPQLDHQWKEQYLQKITDLKKDHPKPDETAPEKLAHHFEPAKTVDKKQMHTLHEESSNPKQDPFNKMEHKKGKYPKKFKNKHMSKF